MEEIAATFRDAGLPDGFHGAAAEVFRRLTPFKDAAADCDNDHDNGRKRQESAMFPRRPLTLLLAVTVSAAHPGRLHGQETQMLKRFHVRDFGAIPDSGDDAGPAIRATIAAAIESGAPAEVVLDKGVYRVGAEPKGEYALTIARARRLAVRGQGNTTELVVTSPEAGGIRLSDCDTVTITGLAIDYAPAPYTQGTVAAVDVAGGTFTLTVDQGFLAADDPAFANAKAAWGIVVRPERAGVPPVYGPIVVPAKAGKRLAARQWQFAAGGPVHGAAEPLRMTGMKAGDRYVHLARNYAAAVLGAQCKDVALEDITVYASPGIAFCPYLCGRVAIRNCHVKRRPGSERLLSTNADGVHCRGCRQGIVVEGCSFEGMADDAINIHSSPIPVKQVLSPQEIVVQRYHYTLRAGDRLAVMDPTEARVRDEVTAREVLEVPGEWAWRVRFDRPVQGVRAGSGFESADNLYNLSECAAGSSVRNCHFRSFRGRGVLLSCQTCVVEENTFDVREGWGVVLFHESTRWGEGPLARDITIARNVFHGQGGYQSAVFAYPTRRDGKLAQSRDTRDLVIRDNRFVDLGVPAVELHSCRDVRILDNSVETRLSAPRPRASYSSVIIDNCSGIEIRSLTVRDTDPRHQSAVRISNSTAPGEDGVRISGLSADLAPECPPVFDRRPGQQ